MYFMPFWGIWRGLFGPSSFWVFFQPFYYCLLILVFCSVSFFFATRQECVHKLITWEVWHQHCVQKRWNLAGGLLGKPGRWTLGLN